MNTPKYKNVKLFSNVDMPKDVQAALVEWINQTNSKEEYLPWIIEGYYGPEHRSPEESLIDNWLLSNGVNPKKDKDRYGETVIIYVE